MTINYISENLVRYMINNTSVIISSTHGGNKIPPNVRTRTCQGIPQHCECKTLRDMYTIEITERIAYILSLTQSTPSAIIADFGRLYIDVNRGSECAYEDPDGALYYNTFHNKLRLLINNVRSLHQTAFLFDIHGTAGKGSDIWDVYIGTGNGNVNPANSSIKQLLTIDHDALLKLRKLFTDKGYRVQPSKSGENELYRGDYILKKYGSNNINGINTIQFEIDDRIRNNSAKRITFADNLAHVIANFVRHY